jgi:hypothetical protein
MYGTKRSAVIAPSRHAPVANCAWSSPRAGVWGSIQVVSAALLEDRLVRAVASSAVVCQRWCCSGGRRHRFRVIRSGARLWSARSVRREPVLCRTEVRRRLGESGLAGRPASASFGPDSDERCELVDFVRVSGGLVHCGPGISVVGDFVDFPTAPSSFMQWRWSNTGRENRGWPSGHGAGGCHRDRGQTALP